MPSRTLPLPVFTLLLCALAPSASAQERTSPMPQWEARADALLSPGLGALGGVGVNLRAGWYARVGIALAAGAIQQDQQWRAQQRLDLTARFLFDPFAQSRRAFYAGAGVGVVREGDDRAQPRLLGIIGTEGAAVGRVVPAVELTLGGGVRLGVVLRARPSQGR